MRRRLALIGIAAVVVLVPAASAADSVPTPANLEVVGVTEDSVTLAWGPTPVSDFTAYDAPKKNSLIVGWTASVDTRGPVTYIVTKNGTLLTSTLEVPEILITGLPPKVKSFRICVTPFAAGLSGPANCATFSRV